MKQIHSSQNGFSLFEALAVVVVLVIVGAVGYIGYTNLVKPNNPGTSQATPVAKKTESTTYYLTHGTTLRGVSYEAYNSTTLPGYTNSF
ncbi:MAG: hypothetical protein JWO07_705 [Candidatus Saccharibacteria bacterium]|nr:hypothetical protein [Candidatus Saccharibacteria bacterium]